MPTPLVRLLIAEAETLEVKNIHVDITSRHYHLIGELEGKRLFQVVSRTPSDSACYKNARAQLRRDVRRLRLPATSPKKTSARVKTKKPPRRIAGSTRISTFDEAQTRLDQDWKSPLRDWLARYMANPNGKRG